MEERVYLIKVKFVLNVFALTLYLGSSVLLGIVLLAMIDLHGILDKEKRTRYFSGHSN